MPTSEEQLAAIKRPDELVRLNSENARLRAIVDKLPVTADGVPVEIGATVFLPVGTQGKSSGEARSDILRSHDVNVAAISETEVAYAGYMGVVFWFDQNDVYSTREAAVAAKDAIYRKKNMP